MTGLYVLKPSQAFEKQLRELNDNAKTIIEQKLRLIEQNPYRYKRIKGHNLLLFRIRFSDNRKEKRAIYIVEKNYIFLVCILDRDRGYKDLKVYLRSMGL